MPFFDEALSGISPRRNAGLPQLNRPLRSVFVAAAQGRDLLAFFVRQGIDAMAHDSGFTPTYLVVFGPGVDLDAVERLMQQWGKGSASRSATKAGGPAMRVPAPSREAFAFGMSGMAGS